MNQRDIDRLLRVHWLADVEHHAMLSSTNDRAVELAKQPGVKMPLLIIADRQTAGRGRGGNRWWTGEGSLAFSFLFEDAPLPLEEYERATPVATSVAPLTGLAAGLAVAEVTRWITDDFIPHREVGLHWPNDVFADGRKVAGVLVEVLSNRKIVVGIGMNLNNSASLAPEELQPSIATVFDLTQKIIHPTTIIEAIANRLESLIYLAWYAPKKLTTLVDAACLQKNHELRLQWGSAIYTGLCRGIDETGAILLETNEGLRAFPSGVILKS